MSLPPVVDGHPLIDNESSRQLVDAARQQLAAVSANPVVGMYGDPGQLPAFVIVAGTTTAGSPDQVLTGMAAGFQQSLGSQELNFVDQPAGPLGGTMRCAEHAPMTTCMWTVDGAFGMNMVFQQDLAQAAATTLKVREAIETHRAESVGNGPRSPAPGTVARHGSTHQPARCGRATPASGRVRRWSER